MRASRAKVAASQDTATTTGTALLASSRACASAPCRGGSNTTASKPLSSAAANGRRNRSRATRLDRLEAGRRSGRALERGRRAASSLSAAVTRARSASRKAKGPMPQNRSATRLAPPTCARTSLRQRGFAFGGRLQEYARRQRHVGAADLEHRRRALGDQFAVTGEAGETLPSGEPRQRRHLLGRERAGAAHVDVEAAVGRGRLDVERLAGGLRASRRWPRPP